MELIDQQYKDVVIIGNGPSAITLSFMLAGNWPYYQGEHPIEYLHSKLSAQQEKSLVQQDLEFLSEGLEGRSSNPVSVLLDCLMHYEADLGIKTPSFLSWKFDPNVAIDHVVIGNGLPGGTWHAMEESTLTISPGTWMELPDLSFREWDLNFNKDNDGLKEARAVVGSVANYYKDYVHHKNLKQNFINNSSVEKVERISSNGKLFWKVQGNSGELKQKFSFVTPSIVLAVGSHKKPNMLSVNGEDLPFVFHSIPVLERQLKSRSIEKLLIIGAGLSAADAIIMAGFYDVPVVHAFRRDVSDPKLIFNQLPQNMYPEYHKIHRMMLTGGAGYHQAYKSLCKHQVREICTDGTVILNHVDDTDISIVKVSHVCVLIGSKPDLSFFPDQGFGLGIESSEPVDSKANPIDINLFTHESFNYKGVYALGPLVGDNFVRFLQGGSLAVTNHLVSKS